jgi:hypothetical protein
MLLCLECSLEDSSKGSLLGSGFLEGSLLGSGFLEGSVIDDIIYLLQYNKYIDFALNPLLPKMKFYETHYEDYLGAMKLFNLHPELEQQMKMMPQHISGLRNMIFYGPPGTGKYTQVLHAIQQYSPSNLAYDKKMNIQTEKYDYTYHISDIHYEIDMSLLGCNSKLIWHDIIQQIVDIVSVKSEKCAIIVCKNFHLIHTELLEIFYSYIQEYSSRFSPIQLKYFLITEHLCFIPNNILASSEIISVKRPNREMYVKLIRVMQTAKMGGRKSRTVEVDPTASDHAVTTAENEFVQKISLSHTGRNCEAAIEMINQIDVGEIMNLKELRAFSKLSCAEKIPIDIFNIVCNNIIQQMLAPESLVHAQFRDALYDIFVYNLDIVECVWHIICNLIENRHLKDSAISDVMTRSYTFLKYYNNNYRPIYHLESMFHYMIIKINRIDELPARF